MLKKVPTIRTNFTTAELTKALIEGWQNLYNGQLPKKEQIGVVYSQWALETGRGSSCWNNNLGNYKAANDPKDPDKVIEYCALNGVWEIINGKRVVLSSDNPGSWFRSFPTLQEGVAFYLDQLKNKRYQAAWVAVEAGDVAQFAHILKQHFYYTAPEADYVKGMQSWFKVFLNDPSFNVAIKEIEDTIKPKVEGADKIFDKLNSLDNK